jgi:ribosome-associated toxin RatA of RatAB toxin-antitoxin module
MTIIQSSIRINASTDKVWNIVSDLDNEPKFWKGTKEIRNISREENKVTREITIAFKDSKCIQEVTLEPTQKIQATFTKGIIDGTKTIELIPIEDTTEVEVTWDIKLSGLMGMFTGMVKNTSKMEQTRLLKV